MVIKRKAKSWKTDAIYYKKRIDELEEQLQSLKNLSVENNKVATGNANIPADNTKEAKTMSLSEKQASSEKEGQNAPNNQKVDKSPTTLKKVQPQAPQGEGDTLQIEEQPQNQEPVKEEPAEETRYNFSCPECSKYFNELNDGCCPFCNVELE